MKIILKKVYFSGVSSYFLSQYSSGLGKVKIFFLGNQLNFSG